LWDHLQSHPVAGTLTITVPRQRNQPQREATLSIRYALVRLRPPQRPKGVKLPSLTVWAVLALEEQPPQGIKPLEWLLLTTVPVDAFDDASREGPGVGGLLPQQVEASVDFSQMSFLRK